MKEKEESIYNPGWQWLGRSLDNYKAMHAKTAADKGLTNELKAAKTLTQARKILWGYKKKNTR
jgi:hypothetical protein